MRQLISIKVISVCLLFCILICSCSAPSFYSQTIESVVSDVAEDAVLDFLIFGDPSEKLLSAAHIIEQDLGIKTNIELQAGGMEGDNIIKTRIATGDMPDIFQYNIGALLYALQPADNLFDITDEPFVKQFTPLFSETTAVDGRLYAVPSSPTASSGGWFYNKEIYKQLGLNIPDTWQTFIANCSKIKDAGITPVLGAYKFVPAAQYILIADAYNLKNDIPDFPEEYTNGNIKFSEYPALRTFEKMEDVSRYLNDDCMNVDINEAIRRLIEGDGAHYIIPASLFISVAEDMSNIGFFSQPGDDPDNYGIVYSLPQGLYIYKYSPKTKIALAWLDYYLSDQGPLASQKYKVIDGPYVTQNKESLTNMPETTRLIEKYIQQGRTSLSLEHESVLKGPNCAQICLSVLIGMSDAKTAAKEYDKDIEKQAIMLKLPNWG